MPNGSEIFWQDGTAPWANNSSGNNGGITPPPPTPWVDSRDYNEKFGNEISDQMNRQVSENMTSSGLPSGASGQNVMYEGESTIATIFGVQTTVADTVTKNFIGYNKNTGKLYGTEKPFFGNKNVIYLYDLTKVKVAFKVGCGVAAAVSISLDSAKLRNGLITPERFWVNTAINVGAAVPFPCIGVPFTGLLLINAFYGDELEGIIRRKR
jgi:hypothetical protein